MSTYLRLLSYVRAHLRIFLIAIGCMAVSSSLGGIEIGAIWVVVDRIFANNVLPIPDFAPQWVVDLLNRLNDSDPKLVLTWTAWMIPILFFIKGLFGFFQNFYMNDVSQRVIRDLRQKLFSHFTALSIDYHSKNETGKMVSRITYDTGVIQNSITEGVSDLFFNLFKVVIYAVIALSIDWKLCILLLIMIPLIGLPIARIGKRLKKLSQQGQLAMGDFNTAILEGLTGIRIIKAFLAEKVSCAKFARTNERSYRVLRSSHKRMNVLSPLTETVGATAGAVFFFYGGIRVLDGSMSLGEFVAFLGAVLQMIHPMKRLARLHGINQQALASAERIFEVLDTQPSIRNKPDAKEMRPFSKEIVYDKVSFQYDDKPALREINLVIPKGETVAVVGPSGGGKTTLVNLLMRFFDVRTGSLKLDGQDVRDVTLQSLRSQIGLVTQETFLFNDTVKANISLGKPDATQAEIEESAKMANAHTFIEKLPQGYDTVIGELGSSLSGGERQRLTIARAFLKYPPMMILDEATSQLDAESEHLVSEALARLTQGRTVIMIAHRLSSVRLAHRILLMQEGRIVEQGNHDELLQKSPLYRRFCELQLMNAEDSSK